MPGTDLQSRLLTQLHLRMQKLLLLNFCNLPTTSLLMLILLPLRKLPTRMQPLKKVSRPLHPGPGPRPSTTQSSSVKTNLIFWTTRTTSGCRCPRSARSVCVCLPIPSILSPLPSYFPQLLLSLNLILFTSSYLRISGTVPLVRHSLGGWSLL